MQKKITMVCMTVVAFAAVVAPASAVQLKENGVTVSTGASITGKNVGHVTFTAGEGTATCTSAHMSGTVTADAGGTTAIQIPAGNPIFTGTGISGDCTSFKPVKITMNSKLCFHIGPNTDNVTLTGCSAEITFTLNYTDVVTCTYSVASMAGIITTAPKDAEMAFSGQPAESDTGSPLFCPRTANLDMELVLTTTDGTTLQFTS